MTEINFFGFPTKYLARAKAGLTIKFTVGILEGSDVVLLSEPEFVLLDGPFNDDIEASVICFLLGSLTL